MPRRHRLVGAARLRLDRPARGRRLRHRLLVAPPARLVGAAPGRPRRAARAGRAAARGRRRRSAACATATRARRRSRRARRPKRAVAEAIERPAGPVAPERFAVLQALLAYLLAACGEDKEARDPGRRAARALPVDPAGGARGAPVAPQPRQLRRRLLHDLHRAHATASCTSTRSSGATRSGMPPRLTPLEARAIRLALEYVGPMIAADAHTPLDKVRKKLEETFGAVRARADAGAAGRARRGGSDRRRSRAAATSGASSRSSTRRRSTRSRRRALVEAYTFERALPHWYVHTWDRTSDGERSFRLDRMRSAKLLKEKFEPREGFEPTRLRGARTRARALHAGDRPLRDRARRAQARRTAARCARSRSAATSGSRARSSRSAARRSSSSRRSCARASPRAHASSRRSSASSACASRPSTRSPGCERPRGVLAQQLVVARRVALDRGALRLAADVARARRARCAAASGRRCAARTAGRSARAARRRPPRASRRARRAARAAAARRRRGASRCRGSTGRRPGRCRSRRPARRACSRYASGIGAGACVQYERHFVASSVPGSSSAPVGQASMQRRHSPQSSVERRRRLELDVGDERAEHDPGAVAARDQQRVLAVEADAAARGRLAVDVLVRVDEDAVRAAEPAAELVELLAQLRVARRTTCSAAGGRARPAARGSGA